MSFQEGQNKEIHFYGAVCREISCFEFFKALEKKLGIVLSKSFEEKSGKKRTLIAFVNDSSFLPCRDAMKMQKIMKYYAKLY